MTMDLEQFQKRFLQGISGTPSSLESIIKAVPGLSIQGRMQIYADDYKARLTNVIRDCFPASAVYLGDALFEDHIKSYIRTYYPCSYTLRDLGFRFAEFCSEKELSLARPAAADLARLEWMIHDLYDGPDHSVATVGDLLQIPFENWGRLRIKLVPNLRVLEASLNVDELWRAGRDGAELPQIVSGRLHILVWRKQEDVYLRRVESFELLALKSALEGKTLEEIYESLVSQTGEVEIMTEFMRLFREWAETYELVAFVEVGH